MKPNLRFSLLDQNRMEAIHRASLELLHDPGMKIMEKGLLQSLEKAGAKVDYDVDQVRFPSELVNETISSIKKDLKDGKNFPVLNGVISSSAGGELAAKFGGACCVYHDLEKGEGREPTNEDVIRMIRLGEALPEVKYVGNPVIYTNNDDGTPILPHLRPIKTAALMAKFTSKPYSCEVWSPESLEFQIEMGCVVKGGWENYKREPIFITAKETISPLQLPPEDAKILMALAEKDLPCTVVPMPLSGGSSPVTAASNVVLANAEILGTWTALRSFAPTCRVAAGVISGVIDMSTGHALFAAPEPIIQDATLAELYSDFYGFDMGMGTGYIDVRYPGAQSLAEKTLKIIAAFMKGKTTYPVGIIEGGKTFCPEEALAELEVAKAIHRLFGGIEVGEETIALDVMREAGIGGNVLALAHTAMNFREALKTAPIFDRSPNAPVDMLKKANEKMKEILAAPIKPVLSEDKSEEIDRIVAKAESYFMECTTT